MFIAHRGASHDAPENTLASVNLAWERGADAVEIDVYLSKDGEIVAIHDDTTKRTGGKDMKVADQTLQELKRLDVGRFKGEKWAGERIPTLKEVLETVPKGKHLFVEIKCGKEIVPELEGVLDWSGLQADQVVVIGFGLDTVAAVKRKMPEHLVYWVSDIKKDEKTGRWSPTADDLLVKARKAGIDGLNVRGCAAVDKAFVDKVKAAGMGCFVWTVNDPADAGRLADAGVGGITTYRPKWLKEKLAEKKGGGG
jgi:glycerophosphoryl diester phosphodiesterase